MPNGNVVNKSGVSNVVLGLVALIVFSLLLLLLVEVMRSRQPGGRPPLPILPGWLGGCEGTRWGCCPDGETAKAGASGWNCDYVPPAPAPSPSPPLPVQPLIGGCAGTRWGCCPDGVNAKVDFRGSNCSSPSPRLIGGCAGTRYGCCRDGRTAKQSPDQIC